FPELIRDREREILADWLALQLASVASRRDLIGEAELRQQSTEFLTAIRTALSAADRIDIAAPEWTPVRQLLTRIAESRVQQGFSPSETATFVFSLKQPVFNQLQALVKDVASLAEELWMATTLIDKLGLFTTELHQKNREAIIMRQQQEMLELSTPVVTL